MIWWNPATPQVLRNAEDGHNCCWEWVTVSDMTKMTWHHTKWYNSMICSGHNWVLTCLRCPGWPVCQNMHLWWSMETLLSCFYHFTTSFHWDIILYAILWVPTELNNSIHLILTINDWFWSWHKISSCQCVDLKGISTTMSFMWCQVGNQQSRFLIMTDICSNLGIILNCAHLWTNMPFKVPHWGQLVYRSWPV